MSKRRLYSIQFHVDADLLPTVISLLSDRVGSLVVHEVEDARQNGAAGLAPRQAHYSQPRAGKGAGRPIQETGTGKLFLSTIEAHKGKCDLTQIVKAFEKEGFAEGSASAAASRLSHAGFIKVVAPRTYEMVKGVNAQ
jgi:hypothetical protein